MEKKPYHHLPDGTFRNPEGSPVRSDTVKFSYRKFTQEKKKIDIIRKRIEDGDLTFEEAAKSSSDEEETKNNGGVLINPTTGDTRFELTKMDPVLYGQAQKLKDNEISAPLLEEDERGIKKYKIIKVSNRFDEHIADYSQDYIKIKDLALKEKQLKKIQNWMIEKIEETYININQDLSLIHI